MESANETIEIDNIIYSINDDNTANVVGFQQNLQEDVFLPKSFKYNSKEYNIMSISQNPFLEGNLTIESLRFPPDSELRMIEKEALANIFIQVLTIPPKLTELKDGWCTATGKLIDVKVDEKNPRYKKYGDKLIIGKSDIQQEKYDVLIFCERDAKTVTIPSFIEIISPFAFSECYNLKEVEFQPDSKLRIIGEESFRMTQIEQITIPKNVTCICDNAFHGCSRLKSVGFPPDSQLKTIGKSAFANTPIEELKIPSNVTNLQDEWVFDIEKLNKVIVDENNPVYKNYDDKLIIGKLDIKQENYDVLVFCSRDAEKIIIPNFIEIISPYAFENCKLLKEVEFQPDSKLRIIGEESFRMTQIEQITIPKNVTCICDNAFGLCSKLKSVEFPPDSQLKTIGKSAFAHARFEELKIPSNVTNLQDGWGFDIEKLNKVIVDENNPVYKNYDDKLIIGKSDIKQENYDVLVFCSRDVEKITIPNFIEIISPHAFEQCTLLKEVEFQHDSKLRIIGNVSFSYTQIENITIPSSVTVIDDYAFSRSHIKKIFIPTNVERIGKYSFEASSIEEIEFAHDSKLKLIDDGAFHFVRFTSVKIPQHVTRIGDGSFEACINLTQIEIPANSELQVIGNSAFSRTQIKSIHFPSSLTTIGKLLFMLNNQLKHVEIPTDSKLQVISNQAFANTKIERIFIPSKVKIIENSAFSRCSKLKEVIFQDDSELQIIEANAFIGTMIESISLPKSVKKIGKTAFLSRKLRVFDIPTDSNLETIQSNAFSFSLIEKLLIPSKLINLMNSWIGYTPKLTNIKVDENNPVYKNYDDKLIIGKSDIKQENYDVLVFCSRDVEKITIPNFIEIISPHAFEQCALLKEVEFQHDSKLRIIGNVSFSYTQIENITIPSSVTTIGSSSFFNCRQLKRIEFSSDSELQHINSSALSKTAIKSITIPPKLIDISEGWFRNIEKLTKIVVDQKNPVYKIHENRMIVKKSSIEQENFNVLVCSFEQKAKVDIPDFIEIIGQHSFDQNKIFRQPLFSDNSKLKIIDKKAFNGSTINCISIPTNVKEIRNQAFSFCSNLYKVNIPLDSNLQIIGQKVFCSTKVNSISIPSHIKVINENAFSTQDKILIIEINDYSYDNKITIRSYQLPINIIIMVSYEHFDPSKKFEI